MNLALQSSTQQTTNDYFNQGDQLKQSKPYQEVSAVYQKAIEINPEYAEFHSSLVEL